ncbi:MAG: SLBB domain-containing protein [Microcoleaceae cyanobacterium]
MPNLQFTRYCLALVLGLTDPFVPLANGIATANSTAFEQSTPELGLTVETKLVRNFEFSDFAPSPLSSVEQESLDRQLSGYWAQSFIEPLITTGVLNLNDIQQPDRRINRGEFIELLKKAFGAASTDALKLNTNPLNSNSINSNSISELSSESFLSRAEALVSLVELLNLTATQVQPEQLNQYFTDAAAIPQANLDGIAAATEYRLVVNYPNVRTLNPNRHITLAETAAFIHQALVLTGKIPSLSARIEQQQENPLPTYSSVDSTRNLQSNLPTTPPVTRANTSVTNAQRIQAIEIAENADYTLGDGDQIQVEIANFPERNGEYAVQINGQVNIPLLGKFSVEGMTLPQLERILTARYSRTMKDPRVTVSLIAARPLNISVAGEVSRPGAYAVPVNPGQFPTITQAVQLAGGITQSANIRNVEVQRSLRSGRSQIIAVDLWALSQTGDLRQDLVLRDGDKVLIPALTQTNLAESPQLVTSNLYSTEAKPTKIAIVGEVFRPGSYTLTAGGEGGGFLTITRAIQEAGGITSTANLQNIQVRRQTRSGQIEIINIDLFALLDQGDLNQDLILADGDTILIPTLTAADGIDSARIVGNNLYSPESKPMKVAVVGEVFRPGPYTLTADAAAGGILTVAQAIQQAGGITSTADLRQIQVKRVNSNGVEEVIDVNLFALLQGRDLRQDAILKNGDTVVVPTATQLTPAEVTELARSTLSPSTIRVNFVGEVVRPGVIEVPPNTPLSQAILAAGGFNNRADEGSVELVRLSPDGTVEKRELQVDFATGIGEENNPTLRSNDIVVVRPSGLASFSDDLSPIMSLLSPFTSIFSLINRLF